MKKAIDIFCKLSEKIWVGLGNTRENMGHDDCLPYQADIFIMNEDNDPYGHHSFKRIASIWNDGWGGESNVELIARTTPNIDDCSNMSLEIVENDVQTLREECAKHQMYWNGKPFAKYTLEDVCDSMAALFIDNPKAAKMGTLIHLLDDDPQSEKGSKPLAVLK